MTFDEWWMQHPYSYADNEEQLKESCKMAWDAACNERIADLEKDLNELTITNDYQRVISNKNEEISALVTKMNYNSEEHKKEFFEMAEIIEYLLSSLMQEGIDLSEEGCETDGYKVYQRIKSLIAERDNWS